MNESNGIEVTIPQKQTARDDPPNQGSHCKHHAGNMRGREKHGSHNDCQRLPGQDSQETEQKLGRAFGAAAACEDRAKAHDPDQETTIFVVRIRLVFRTYQESIDGRKRGGPSRASRLSWG